MATATISARIESAISLGVLRRSAPSIRLYRISTVTGDGNVNGFISACRAIARFTRGAIEIRVLDVQECPAADLAMLAHLDLRSAALHHPITLHTTSL